MNSSISVFSLAILFALSVGTGPAPAATIFNNPQADLYGTWLTAIDGSVIAGNYSFNAHSQGFIYNGSTYTTILGPSGSFGTHVQGISGNTAVGYYYDSNVDPHGFIYNITTAQLTTLNDPQGTSSTYVYGVSGSNIVGYSNNRSFFYNGSSFSTISSPAGYKNLKAYTIEGNFIGGQLLDTATSQPHGFIYNKTTNTYKILDVPSAMGNSVEVHDISTSGSSAVGWYYSAGGPHGFFYDGTTFTNIDVTLSGYQTLPFGLSGNTVDGEMYNPNSAVARGFITTLPEPSAFVLLLVASACLVGHRVLRRPTQTLRAS